MFTAVYPIIPWADLYNVAGDPLAASEAGPATAAFVGMFLLALPFGLASQVRSAFQEGMVQSAFAAVGNLATLALLVLAIASNASLPLMVVALTVGPVAASAANLAVLLRFQRPWLSPGRSDVTVQALRAVVGLGLSFMAVQIAYAVAFTTDRLVAAQVVGPAAVADYAVVYRLFTIPASLASIALLPLWPAYREAISRSDLGWVRTTLNRSLIAAALVTVPLAVALVALGPSIVALWTRDAVSPPHLLYAGLGVFTVVFAVASALWMLLNAAQAMRFQFVTTAIMAAVNVVASAYLASRLGIAGIALGQVVGLVGVSLLPTVLYVRRLLGRLAASHERGDS
jgi:O-antigen/teichoic acid export membrane protein